MLKSCRLRKTLFGLGGVFVAVVPVMVFVAVVDELVTVDVVVDDGSRWSWGAGAARAMSRRQLKGRNC